MAERKRLGLRVETGPNTQNPTEPTREKVVRSTPKDDTSDGILFCLAKNAKKAY